MKVINTYIGRDQDFNLLVILETEICWFVSFWDGIHAHSVVDPISEDAALEFIRNANTSNKIL